MNLLLVSNPVGPLGTGMGGGVELTMHNVAKALGRYGHQIDVIAPAGSRLDQITLIEVPGRLQPSAQYQDRDAPIAMPSDAVLANMWERAHRLQPGYDLVVNFAYDWLPFYLTSFFTTPVAHLVSMSSLLDAMDSIIEVVARTHADSVAMHTQAQARTFSFGDRCRILGNGLDLDLYPFNPAPEAYLCWVGRIAPEKGLEDAVAAAQFTGVPLEIFGLLQDPIYWRRIQEEFAGVPVRYHGFLDTVALARSIGRSRALLMTPKWTEAFGNVVMESLACGTPVIAYRRGGPAEMVEHGRTGWLVEPDSIDGLIEAVHHSTTLDRHACRAQAERDYSLMALGTRWEQWLTECGRSKAAPDAAC